MAVQLADAQANEALVQKFHNDLDGFVEIMYQIQDMLMHAANNNAPIPHQLMVDFPQGMASLEVMRTDQDALVASAAAITAAV